MTAEIVTLVLGLAIGGAVVWFVLQAKIQHAGDKAKAESETARAGLAERLHAKEQQIEGLTASLDKANEEIKKLQNELKSESEKRATAEEKNTRIPGLEEALILSRFQVETNYPRPSRKAAQAFTVSRQLGQALFQLSSDAGQV